ncbi:MAG: LysE family transporter [Bdellovibrionota bacterium]
MLSIIEISVTGLLFGISNGISPGPLSVLTISETIRGGMRQGFKVACSPLITDLPIITFSLLILSKQAHYELTLSVLSIAGAFFLFFLTYKSFTYVSSENGYFNKSRNTLVEGVVTNLLNPYPYIFWLTVGAPYASKLLFKQDVSAVSFFLAFYIGMFISKSAIILAALRGRGVFAGKAYGYCMKVIGFILCMFGVRFAMEGLNFIFRS